MSQLTLPGLARKRRNPGAEAAIPCVTDARTATATATHLTGDRDREPRFDDLPDPVTKSIGYDDITGDAPAPAPAAARKSFRYPGVAREAIAWMRDQDAAEQLPAGRDEDAFSVDRLVPAGILRAVQVEVCRTETPVAELCAAVGLVYARRGTAVSL